MLNGSLRESALGMRYSYTQGCEQSSCRAVEFMPSYIDRKAALRCFSRQDVILVGDSRLRYLYASLADLLIENASTISELPKHRACPYANQLGVHSAQCVEYYSAHNWSHVSQVWHAGNSPSNSRIIYEPNLLAADAAQAFQRLARVDSPNVFMLLANVGAYTAYDLQFHTNFTPGAHTRSESSDAFIAFYLALGQAVKARFKVAVAYPDSCFGEEPYRTHPNSVAFNAHVTTTLRRNGWIIYEPVSLTSRGWFDPACRRSSLAGHNGHEASQPCPSNITRFPSLPRVWSTELLPLDVVQSVITPKWDQCNYAHTFDTLADLEWQVLLNAAC